VIYHSIFRGIILIPTFAEMDVKRMWSTCNFLAFVNTTTIASGQRIDQSLRILVVCNSSCVYKRQKITSTLFCLWVYNGIWSG